MHVRLPLVPFCIWLSLLAACGGGGGTDAGHDASLDTSPSDGGSDSSSADSAAGDGGVGDGSVDGGDAGTPDCASLLRAGVDLPLARDLPDTQIHPYAVFDGLGVWLAFSLPESGDSGFDTWATRVACDGSALVAPFLVNPTDVAPNDVDPVVGLSADRLLVAWNADTGAATANLAVGYRAFALDGTAMGDERRLLLDASGAAYDQNALLSVVVPEGPGFRLGGTRGVEASGTFQVFTQSLDGSLDVVDAGAELFAEVGVTQQHLALAPTSDGTLFAAWDRDDGSSAQVVHASTAAGSPAPVVSLPGLVRTAGPSVAVDPDDPMGRLVALAAGGETRSQIRVLDAARPDVTPATLGMLGRMNFSPQLAMAGGVGAVAWLRNESGLRNTLFVQGLRYDGASFSLDSPIELSTAEPVAPYAPTLTRVSDDVYFVAWAQGSSPAFRIFGRFVVVR